MKNIKKVPVLWLVLVFFALLVVTLAWYNDTKGVRWDHDRPCEGVDCAREQAEHMRS
ncbi:MAG: hypothetical protein RL150_302 [Candidatus Parcubacteria bacterium]|jgi:hypothetical protein